MKLELKHLAPYLPYGVSIYSKYNNDKSFSIWKMGLGNIWNVISHDSRKPILRPLSDLSKDIDGIIPILEILDINGKPNREIDRCYTNGKFIYEKGFRYGVELDGEKNTEWQISETIFLKRMPFITYQYLLSNHFDVFGLIEKGLAIDINTIDI